MVVKRKNLEFYGIVPGKAIQLQTCFTKLISVVYNIDFFPFAEVENQYNILYELDFFTIHLDAALLGPPAASDMDPIP